MLAPLDPGVWNVLSGMGYLGYLVVLVWLGLMVYNNVHKNRRDLASDEFTREQSSLAQAFAAAQTMISDLRISLARQEQRVSDIEARQEQRVSDIEAKHDKEIGDLIRLREEDNRRCTEEILSISLRCKELETELEVIKREGVKGG